MALQYSTPNRTRQAVHETARGRRGRNEDHAHTPSGLHADELAVKPHGTSTNRTSSRASDAPARRVRSSRAENRGFFQNPPPPDGPRRPWAASLPAADVHALGNGTIAGDDVPCPCRLPDTAGPQAAVSKAAPLDRRLRYSTVREDEGEKTTSRTPSTNRSAHDNGQVLAAAAKRNHAGPQTKGAPTPEGQVPAAELPTPLRDAFESLHPPAHTPSLRPP